MKVASFVLFSLLAVGCNLPFDTASNTPAQSRKKAGVTAESGDERPAPSSPFMGYRFYFDGPMPDGWYVSSRGDDQSLEPGYAALCVVSHRGGNDKVLFLLATGIDGAARKEVASHMNDADWWQPRVPVSFIDMRRAGADSNMHVTKGQFANVDTVLLFTVLRCAQDSCESSLAESRTFATRLQMRSARADDEHVASPSANDCGSRF